MNFLLKVSAMLKRLKNSLLNRLTKNLLNLVSVDQILTVNDLGQVFLDNRLIKNSELLSLQEEVKAFQNFRLKTIIMNTPEVLAKTQMFENSKSYDDMMVGKSILYTIDVQKQVMEKIINAPMNVEQK